MLTIDYCLLPGSEVNANVTAGSLTVRNISFCPRTSGFSSVEVKDQTMVSSEEVSVNARKSNIVSNHVMSGRMVTKYLTPDNNLLNSSTEDIRVIEEQVSEIRDYNLRMESELNRVRSEYSLLEQQMENFEKVREK